MALLLGLMNLHGNAQNWPPKPLPGYNIFNDQQEIWLGEILAEAANLDSRVLKDAEATAYLQGLGEQLAAKSKRPGLPYKFYVYESDEPNAYALPGGQINVTRGMVSFCQNEGELAGILGHEIAHVALRQGAKTFSRWLFWVIGVDKVGDKEDISRKELELEVRLAETNNFQRIADLYLGIARTDEMLADKYGIWNVHAVGFDPQRTIDVMERFDAVERRQREQSNSWEQLLLLIFSAHPPPQDRANLLKMEAFWMKKRKDAVVDTPTFQQFKKRVLEEKPGAGAGAEERN